MTPGERLQAAALCAAIIRRKIEMNDGCYSGSFVPNLQSIMDLATVADRHLGDDVMERLEKIAEEVGL